ncbi:hypothetical protein GGF43_003352 [Coemansia sp. RSA 2618]|nr:hypothetical protein GGF43_003352 [Coemansia sp. RSA 2618]
MDNHVTVDITHGSVVVSIDVMPEHGRLVGAMAKQFSPTKSDTATPIELHAQFLEHCMTQSQDVAQAVLGDFCRTYGIPATSIHVVVQQHGLDEAAARQVLKAYYLLWDVPAAHCYYFDPANAAQPALFASASARVTAMFGGQPGSSAYLDEARWLLDVYRPLLADFVASMSAFLNAASKDSRLDLVYRKGLDVQQWLAQPGSEPDTEYLISAPVSMPLTGFVQLMHVMVLFKTLGVSPGQLAQLFKEFF